MGQDVSAPPYTHEHTYLSPFQHILNQNVNSHFSHWQRRMNVVGVCVFVCMCVGRCAAGTRPMTDMENSKRAMSQAISKISMEGDLNGVSWRCCILLMSVVETASAWGHLSLFLAVFIVISRSYKEMNTLCSVVWCNWIRADVHLSYRVNLRQSCQCCCTLL